LLEHNVNIVHHKQVSSWTHRSSCNSDSNSNSDSDVVVEVLSRILGRYSYTCTTTSTSPNVTSYIANPICTMLLSLFRKYIGTYLLRVYWICDGSALASCHLTWDTLTTPSVSH